MLSESKCHDQEQKTKNSEKTKLEGLILLRNLSRLRPVEIVE